MRTLRFQSEILEKHFTNLKKIKIKIADFGNHQCRFYPSSNLYSEYLGFIKCQICKKVKYIDSKECQKLFPNLLILWTSWGEYISKVNQLAKLNGKKTIKTCHTKRFYGSKAYFNEFYYKYIKFVNKYLGVG